MPLQALESLKSLVIELLVDERRRACGALVLPVGEGAARVLRAPIGRDGAGASGVHDGIVIAAGVGAVPGKVHRPCNTYRQSLGNAAIHRDCAHQRCSTHTIWKAAAEPRLAPGATVEVFRVVGIFGRAAVAIWAATHWVPIGIPTKCDVSAAAHLWCCFVSSNLGGSLPVIVPTHPL